MIRQVSGIPTAAGKAAAGAALLLALLAGCSEPTVGELMGSAREAITKKDSEAARLNLKGALQQAPDNAEARFLLGQLLHDNGDMAGAEVELRRALELQHPDNQVLPLLAASMLALNKAGLLLQQFGGTQLTDAAAMTQLQTVLAQAEAAQGNLDAALGRTDAVLRGRPEHGPALLLRARLTAARGDVAGAAAQVQALLARQADNAEAWHLQGDLLLRAGSPKPGLAAAASAPDATAPAMAAYRKAIELKPDNVAAHAALIGLHMAAADTAAATTQWQALQKAAPRHPQTLFFEAVLAERKGDYKRTRELSQLLLRGTPNNVQALLLAGQAELKLNALAQAEAHLARAVQLASAAPLPRRQLAQVLLRSGQADKALATLAPLLDASTTDVEALTLAAQAQLMKGDNAAADQSFARAAKLKPDDMRVRLAVALSNVAKDAAKGGKATAALAELRAVAAADKGSAADLALINVLSRSNDLSGAMQAVDALAVKLPNDALPDQLRGRLALQQKDPAAARKHFEQSLAKNADFLPAMAGLAALDLADKQPAAAKARFEAALTRNPKNVGAMLALAELAARSGGSGDEVLKWLNGAVAADPADATARLLLVDQLLSTQQTKLAQDAAETGLVALPDNAELLDRLGRAQLSSGQAQQAVNTFTKLAAVAPRAALPQLRLADAHAATRNSTAMAAAVRRAAEIAPDQLLVQQAQVNMALLENRFDQALTIGRKLQARYPDQAVGFSIEGDVELRRKNWDAAAAALRKAVARKTPGDAPQRLHAALLAAKKSAEAEAMAADWRQANPNDMAFVLHLGDQAMATSQTDAAESMYRQVISAQPDNVLALNNLAYLLASQKKPGAVALAEQALKRAPKAPAVMDTLAMALAAEQQLPRAVEVQKQAVAAAPEAHAFRLQLARLLIESGDKANARSELSALAALGNKFPRQTEVAALIKQADQ